jgi:toxin ParE1/3/4
MKRVRVTCDAERDLDQIWIYIARDNMDGANRLVDELTARFVIIGSSPEMGRTRDELKSGLRSHPVSNYIIYYREMQGYISIVHIIHGARDPKRVFKS